MVYTYYVSSKVNPANGKVMDLIRMGGEIPRKYFEVWEPKEDGSGEWVRYYQGFTIQTAFGVSDPVGIAEAEGVVVSAKMQADGIAALNEVSRKISEMKKSVLRAALYLQRQGK